MKTKLTKKEFRSLLMSIACALITVTNHHILNDEEYISYVWQYLARTALLGYPQDDIAWFRMTENYLTDLCRTIS